MTMDDVGLPIGQAAPMQRSTGQHGESNIVVIVVPIRQRVIVGAAARIELISAHEDEPQIPDRVALFNVFNFKRAMIQHQRCAQCGWMRRQAAQRSVMRRDYDVLMAVQRQSLG